jgi:O-antigen/teichoic acid export membrane protein
MLVDYQTTPEPDLPEPPDGAAPEDSAGGRTIRGGVMRLAGYGAAALLSALSAAILLRALGVEDAGRYVSVIALIGIVGGISDIGLAAVGLREFSTRGGADRDLFFRDLIGMRLAFTGTAIFVGMGIAAALGFDATQVVGAGLFGFAFLLVVLQGVFAIPMMASLRYGWVSSLDVIRQFGLVLAVAALAIAGAGLLPYYAALIPGALFVVALAAWLIHGIAPVRPAFHPGRWWAIVRDILPFAVAAGLNVVYLRLGAVVIAVVSTATQTGYYGAAFRITEVLNAAIPTVLIVLMPVLSRASAEDVAHLEAAMGKVLRTSLVFAGLAIVSVWTAAPVIIDVIAGEEFEGAVVPLRIQGIALGASVIVTGLGMGLLAHRQHRTLLISNLIAVTAAAVLTITLGGSHGAEGASWALAAAESLLALSYLVSLARTIELGELVAAIWVALGAVGAIAIVDLLGMSALPAFAVGVSIYVATVLLTRSLPPEVWARLRPSRAS